MTDILTLPFQLIRPRPPAEMLEEFESAPQVWDWATRVFLAETSPLFNPDHAHLRDASVGVLWTHVDNVRQQRQVVGMAEMPMNRGNAWQRARAEMQLRELFGAEPTFVITLSAPYCAEIDDASFCALIEHEMFHCGQALDDFGNPRFNKNTGAPIYAMRGHDAEEFVGVVERYGVGAAASGVRAIVSAAAQPPTIGIAEIASACGTCLRSAA